MHSKIKLGKFSQESREKLIERRRKATSFGQNEKIGPGTYDKMVAFPAYKQKGLNSHNNFLNKLTEKYEYEELKEPAKDSKLTEDVVNEDEETILFDQLQYLTSQEITDLQSPMSCKINPTYFLTAKSMKIYPQVPSFGNRAHRFKKNNIFKNEVGPARYSNNENTISRCALTDRKIMSLREGVKNKYMEKVYPEKIHERLGIKISTRTAKKKLD